MGRRRDSFVEVPWDAILRQGTCKLVQAICDMWVQHTAAARCFQHTALEILGWDPSSRQP